MSACPRPLETFPARVPLKVIGRAAELDPERVAGLIYERLASTPPPPDWRKALDFAARPKGAWIGCTFWVMLPDAETERPLREAIQRLPGVVMQL